MKTLEFHSVMKQLSNFDPTSWRDLGTKLQLPPHKLNAIAAGIAGKPHGQNEALTNVVDFWLKNDLEASWEKLAMAVEECGDAVRARNIREDVGLIPPRSGINNSTITVRICVEFQGFPM